MNRRLLRPALFLLLSSLGLTGRAAAPASQNFDALLSQSSPTGGTLTFSGVVYSTNSTNDQLRVDTVANVTGNLPSLGSGQALSSNWVGTNTGTFFQFASTSNVDNFKLTSFNAEVWGHSALMSEIYAIKGYDNGSEVASATVNFRASSTYGAGTSTVTYTRLTTPSETTSSGDGANAGTLTFTGSAWGNIDQVRMIVADTSPNTILGVMIDNLVFAAPALAASTHTFDVAGNALTGIPYTSGETYILAAAPVTPLVASMSPSSGPAAGGTVVVLTGTSFTGATAVTFSSTPATTFTVNNSTTITATAPANAPGAAGVTVTTAAGTSTAGVTFTYVSAPTVAVTAPSGGPVSGGTKVTLTGTDFNGATAVMFGTTPAALFTVDSSTSLTTTAPAHAAGVTHVTVTTAGGTSATGSLSEFTYFAAPTVASLSPTAGSIAGGTTVVITGTGFAGATGVDFGIHAATSFAINNSTTITATAPAGALGVVNVTVTNPGGTSPTASGNEFTYADPGTVEIVSQKDPAAADYVTSRSGDAAVVSSSISFALSEDGRYEVFISPATNVIPSQTAGGAGNNVFLRDRVANTTKLVSRVAGTTTTTAGSATSVSISNDGRYISFVSTATNLVSPATSLGQIFLYDREGNAGAGSVMLVSHLPASATTGGSGISGTPLISRDGSTIAFASSAIDLVSPFTPGTAPALYRYDRASDNVTLASPKNGVVTSNAGIDGASTLRAVSDDGRWIAFSSAATDAAADQVAGAAGNAFLFDAQTGTTRLLNRAVGTAATAANGIVSGAVNISSDGRYVTFLSAGTNLVSGYTGSGAQVYLYNRVTDTMKLVSHSISSATTSSNAAAGFPTSSLGVPVVSRDGRFIAFSSTATDLVTGYSGSGTQYYLYDRLGNSGTGSITLITHSASSATTGAAGTVVGGALSPNGSRFIFSSVSSNVMTGINAGGVATVYAYNTVTGAFTFVSGTAANASAGSANGAALNPTVSANGTYIGFYSVASDLVVGDNNAFGDIFGSVQPFIAIIPEMIGETVASGSYGSGFNYSILATNYPTTYRVIGTLPTGVTLDTTTGVISGTPTQAGTFNLTVEATNTGGVITAPLTLTLAPVAPAAPTNATATAGSGSASVAFTVPANDGGSTITGYIVTASPGGLTGTGTTSPISVNGLNDGTAYTFTVTAVNSVGPSVASAPSAPVVPVSPPGTPTNVNVVGGDTVAVVSFTPPVVTGGTPITLYTVTSNPGGITATGSTSPITVTGLTNGIGYTFTVTATNSAGTSSVSDPSPSVVPAVPDTTPPTVAIAVSDSILSVGETATVTFTFSEAVAGFGTNDVTVPNGTLSALSSADGGITFTATLTPTAGVTQSTNVVSVNLTGLADLVGNVGVGSTNSPNYAIDTIRPALASTIAISDPALKVGDTATITLIFSEVVTGFTTDDLLAPNGVISALSSSDGITWTATFTPTASIADATNVISLSLNGVNDVAGNVGLGTIDSGNYVIDTARPTATIVVADNALKIGETSNVTVTFSEAVTGFANADLTVANGTLTNVASSDGGVTFTATFTPTANITGATNLIALNNTGVTDLAGNAGTGSTNSNNYTIDTSAPTIAISVISTDDRLNLSEAASPLTISGTTFGVETGNTVIVTLNSLAYTGTVSNNAWSLAVPSSDLTGLTDGAQIVAANVSDLAGNPATQATRTLTVDKAVPVAPVLVAISNDTGSSTTDFITSDTTLIFSGTAEANSTVTVTRLGTGVLGTATANGAGAWTYDYSGTTLAAGEHSFIATATDSAGNASAASSAIIVTVDTTTSAPVIASISGDTGSSTNDGTTSDNTLTLSGTAEPNSVITITRSGLGTIGTATANSSGVWTFVYATALVDGSYLFNASAVDLAGQTSSVSADFPVVIDTTAPTAPAFTGITTDTGASATDGITTDSTLSLAGTAEPSTVVTITRSGIGIIGTATAGLDGKWTFDYTATTLLDGVHAFTATTADTAGNTSVASTVFTVTIDTTAPVVTSSPTAAATYNSPFTHILAATGAVNYSATGLPSGLTLNASTGEISGTPTTSGAFTVNFTVTDAAGNSVPGSVVITVARLNLTIAGAFANSRVYDGTTVAALNFAGASLVGISTGDTVTLDSSAATGAFASKEIGTNKPVTVTGLVLSGPQALNYTVSAPTLSANITGKILTVANVVANDRVYDGSTAAQLNVAGATLVGRASSDDVDLVTTSATGMFANKLVALDKPVTISGLTLTGQDAANYTLVQPTSVADITPKNLTLTGVTVANKAYDASTVATPSFSGATFVGVVPPDSVTLVTTDAVANFSDAAIGTDKSVATTGLALAGTDAANYTLTPPLVTAAITAKALTVEGILAANRTYDGTTAVALNVDGAVLVGKATADTLTLDTSLAVGAFANRTVGTNKPVTISGLTISGPNASNYTLTQPTATASIAAKSLMVTGITAANKIYDGSTTAVLTFTSPTLVGVVMKDDVTLGTGTASGQYANANAGAAKPVTVTGLTLAGEDAVNYTLTAPALEAEIQRATAVVTIGGLTHVYDGTTKQATVSTTPTLPVALNYSATPLNAGTYTVSASVNDANYIGGASANLTIAQASQTLTFTLSGGSLAVGTPINLNAVASSGLPVTFSIVSGDATLSGATVTVNSPNPVVVRATQAGNANYLPVSADQTITGVTKLNQAINFPQPVDRAADEPAFNLNATASSGLPVSFVIVSGPAMLSGSSVTLIGAEGTVVVRASQAGNSTYNPATDVTRSFEVVQDAGSLFFGDVSSSLGTIKAGDVAAAFPANSTAGTLMIVVPGLGVNAVFHFNVAVDGSFVATVVIDVPNGVAADSGLPARAAAPVTVTVRGQLLNGVLSGRLDGFDLSFSTRVLPFAGATSDIAGFYQSSSLNTSTGGTYSIVGPQNQVLVVAQTPTINAGALGTVANDGTFTVAAPSTPGSTANVTITGNVDAPSTTVTGTITAPNQPPVSFAGLSSETQRTDRMINLSSRARVAGNVNELITGFVIGGTEPKTVLLRAVGPALAPFGITDALPAARLRLFDGQGRLLREVEGWRGDTVLPQDFARVGAFALSDGNTDAALITTLAPGAYTMHVVPAPTTAGAPATGVGIGLAEIYDASVNPQGEYQRLVNISSRGTVLSSDGVLIGGFVITGNSPKRVLVRGVGPGLAAYGVNSTLTDPVLTLFSENTVLARNDNWGTPVTVNTTQSPATGPEITAAGRSVGAFDLAAGSRDAAVVVTLAPGAYTAQVAGAGGGTGTALIEIYEIPSN